MLNLFKKKKTKTRYNDVKFYEQQIQIEKNLIRKELDNIFNTMDNQEEVSLDLLKTKIEKLRRTIGLYNIEKTTQKYRVNQK